MNISVHSKSLSKSIFICMNKVSVKESGNTFPNESFLCMFYCMNSPKFGNKALFQNRSVVTVQNAFQWILELMNACNLSAVWLYLSNLLLQQSIFHQIFCYSSTFSCVLKRHPFCSLLPNNKTCAGTESFWGFVQPLLVPIASCYFYHFYYVYHCFLKVIWRKANFFM